MVWSSHPLASALSVSILFMSAPACECVRKCERPASGGRTPPNEICFHWKIGLKLCGANHRRRHCWLKREFPYVGRRRHRADCAACYAMLGWRTDARACVCVCVIALTFELKSKPFSPTIYAHAQVGLQNYSTIICLASTVSVVGCGANEICATARFSVFDCQCSVAIPPLPNGAISML